MIDDVRPLTSAAARLRVAKAVAIACAFVALTLLIPLLVLGLCAFVWFLGVKAMFWATLFAAMFCFYVWTMALSRPPRARQNGARVDRRSQPRLIEIVEAEAARMGVSVPRAVDVDLGADAGVAERGFLRRRTELHLGLALLDRLGIAQLRVLLAHEFAHVAGRDVRSGRWIAWAHRTVSRGNEGLNPAIAKLWGDRFLSRVAVIVQQQELAADELAARMHGAEISAETLSDVARCDLAWSLYWFRYLAPALDAARLPPVLEGFSRLVASEAIRAFLDGALAAGLEHEQADPFASHPPLARRLAVVRRAGWGGASTAPDAEQASAIELLDDVDGLVRAALAARAGEARIERLKPLAWSDSFEVVAKPGLEQLAASVAGVVAPVELAELPERLGRLAAQVRVQIGDADGWDPTAEGIGAMLALTLWRAGWSMEGIPGALIACSPEGATVEPVELIERLAQNEFTPDQWRRLCAELCLPPRLDDVDSAGDGAETPSRSGAFPPPAAIGARIRLNLGTGTKVRMALGQLLLYTSVLPVAYAWAKMAQTGDVIMATGETKNLGFDFVWMTGDGKPIGRVIMGVLALALMATAAAFTLDRLRLLRRAELSLAERGLRLRHPVFREPWLIPYERLRAAVIDDGRGDSESRFPIRSGTWAVDGDPDTAVGGLWHPRLGHTYPLAAFSRRERPTLALVFESPLERPRPRRDAPREIRMSERLAGLLLLAADPDRARELLAGASLHRDLDLGDAELIDAAVAEVMAAQASS